MKFMLCYFCLSRSGSDMDESVPGQVPTWVCDTCWRERAAKRKGVRQ